MNQDGKLYLFKVTKRIAKSGKTFYTGKFNNLTNVIGFEKEDGTVTFWMQPGEQFGAGDKPQHPQAPQQGHPYAPPAPPSNMRPPSGPPPHAPPQRYPKPVPKPQPPQQADNEAYSDMPWPEGEI